MIDFLPRSNGNEDNKKQKKDVRIKESKRHHGDLLSLKFFRGKINRKNGFNNDKDEYAEKIRVKQKYALEKYIALNRIQI